MGKRKKDKHPVGKPVMVRWTDSMACSGWRAEPGSKMEITSVGFKVGSFKDRIAIVQSRSHYNDGELIEIPRHAVVSITPLVGKSTQRDKINAAAARVLRDPKKSKKAKTKRGSALTQR